MSNKKQKELTDIEKAEQLINAERENRELADKATTDECLKEIEVILKKHGRTIVSPVNHYMFLLMEKEFNKNPDTVINNDIRVVKAAKEK